MFAKHRYCSIPQTFLIFILLYASVVFSSSSSKTGHWKGNRIPEIPPPQLQSITHTLSDNEDTDKGQSNLGQSSNYLKVDEDSSIKIKVLDERKNTKYKDSISGTQAAYKGLTYFPNSCNTTSCFHFPNHGAVKDRKNPQKKGNGRLKSTNFPPTTSLLMTANDVGEKKSNEDYASGGSVLETLETVKDSHKTADFAEDATTDNNFHSAKPRKLRNRNPPTEAVNVVESSSLATQSSLMQVDASPLSLPRTTASTKQQRAKLQVGKSDVSLMKSEINRINDIAGNIVAKVPSTTTSSTLYQLFLATKSKSLHGSHGENERRHISGESSLLYKSTIYPWQAEKQPTKTGANIKTSLSIGKAVYLSCTMGNESQKEEHLKKNCSYHHKRIFPNSTWNWKYAADSRKHHPTHDFTSQNNAEYSTGADKNSNGVLERLDGGEQPANNIHPSPGTKITIGLSSSSTTRNCCSSFGKQAASGENETLIETGLSAARNSYVLNKSSVENAHDSLTSGGGMGCKCKCQTKHGFHFTICSSNFKQSRAVNSTTRSSDAVKTIPVWRSVETAIMMGAGTTPEKDQLLEKLDSLIETRSFEHGKTVAGTKSISTFDNSLDSVAQTPSTSLISKEKSDPENPRRFIQRQNPQITNEHTWSSGYGHVSQTKKHFCALLRNKDDKGLCRKAVMKNSLLLKNFIRHHPARTAHHHATKKNQNPRIHPLIINSAKKYPPKKTIAQKFVKNDKDQKSGSLASHHKSHLKSLKNKSIAVNDNDIDFPDSTIVTGNYAGDIKFERNQSQTPGSLFPTNDLNKKALTKFSLQTSNDAYRFQFERKSIESSQITTQQPHASEREKNNITKKASNSGESYENSIISPLLPIPTTSKPTSLLKRDGKFSSLPIFPFSKGLSLKHDTDGCMTRSSIRKRPAIKGGEAIVNEMLIANRKCFSRLSWVNTRKQNKDREEEVDIKNEFVLMMPTTTPTSQESAGIPKFIGNHDQSSSSKVGAKLINAFERVSEESKVTSRLSRPIMHKTKIGNSSVDSRPNVEAAISGFFEENEREGLRKRSKRGTRCRGKVTASYEPASAHGGHDGCGNTGGWNLSRKLIPAKESSPVVSSTWDESGQESVMNTNTNYKNSRYEVTKPIKSTHNQVSGGDDGEVNPLPARQNISPTIFVNIIPTFPTETRSENRKMTRKIADERGKVVTTDYKFPPKQWMSDNINDDGRKKATSRESRYGEAAELSPENTGTPRILRGVPIPYAIEPRVLPNISNYDNASPQHFFRMKVGHKGKTLISTPIQYMSLKNSMSSTEHELHALSTIVSSTSLQIPTTAKPYYSEKESAATSSASSSLRSFMTTRLMGEETITSPLPTNINQDNNDMTSPSRNEEMDVETFSTTTSATTSSKNYEHDSSALTLLTSATSTTNAAVTFPSTLSVSVTIPATRTEEATGNSISILTTQASYRADTEEVKATNGFTTTEQYSHSTQPSVKTTSDEQSKADVGKLATDPSVGVGTTFHHSSPFTLSDATTTTVAIQLSTNKASTTIMSEVGVTKSTPTGTSDETISPVATTTATTASSPHGGSVTPKVSDIPSTTSPLTVTQTSSGTPAISPDNVSPTEMTFTKIQDASTQPLGTTFMSTLAANLEDANMPTTSASITTTNSLPMASPFDDLKIVSPVPTSPGPPTTVLILTTTEISKVETEKAVTELESTPPTTTPPLVCDQSKGLMYSDENKMCTCKAGLVYDRNADKCVSLVGNECAGDEEASSRECPLNSLCKSVEQSGVQKGICTCIPGYIPTVDKSHCMAGWNSDCSSAEISDITIKHQCHPDFDCVSKQGDTKGKCTCKGNRTAGLPFSFESNGADGELGSTLGNEQQIKCFLDYGSDCDPLNDECNDFRFLKCSIQNAKCECADSNNQLYDERTRECVARAGTFCSLARNDSAPIQRDDKSGEGNINHDLKGDVRFLACIGNSTCSRIGNETNSWFSGTCKCISGYDQHWQGYCTMKGAGSFTVRKGNLLLNVCIFVIAALLKRYSISSIF